MATSSGELPCVVSPHILEKVAKSILVDATTACFYDLVCIEEPTVTFSYSEESRVGSFPLLKLVYPVYDSRTRELLQVTDKSDLT